MTVEAQSRIQRATREYLTGRLSREAYWDTDIPSLTTALVRQHEHISRARTLEKLGALRGRIRALLGNPPDSTSIESG